jgi:hypothetical protein
MALTNRVWRLLQGRGYYRVSANSEKPLGRARPRVAAPLRTIIAEETGKMVRLSNTLILAGLTCQGICFKNCPRANHLYWREIWLRRV